MTSAQKKKAQGERNADFVKCVVEHSFTIFLIVDIDHHWSLSRAVLLLSGHAYIAIGRSANGIGMPAAQTKGKVVLRVDSAVWARGAACAA